MCRAAPPPVKIGPRRVPPASLQPHTGRAMPALRGLPDGPGAQAVSLQKQNSPQVTPPTLTRAERLRLHLDAPDVILFRGVQPGGTFKLRFTLQNVDTMTGKTLHLSWSAPQGRSARLFHIDYPLPVKLRPGCAHTVEVVFKAAASHREEAYMDFSTQDGAFRVPILTQEAQLSLQVRLECCTPALHRPRVLQSGDGAPLLT